MFHTSIATSWQIDVILNEINLQGFSIIDQAYPASFLNAVEQECLDNLQRFREASIQNGVISKIRSDHILWIDENLPLANSHIQSLSQLSATFNRHFFTGIKEVEAHFACYHAGEFYALHRDNPQQKNDRVISTVFYVHSAWQEDWGGQLRLQDKNQIWHIIPPLPNRIVLFQSDLLHEVLMTEQKRLSITAWLRSTNSVWN